MKLDPTHTRELVRAIRSGNRQAFDELFTHVGGKIYIYIYNQMGEAFRAVLDPEDVLQDVYARGFTAFDEYREEDGAFAAWMIGIARNCLRSLHRHHFGREKRDAGRVVPLEESPDASRLVNLPPAPDMSPSRIVARNTHVREVAEAVAELEEDDRRLVLLHIYEGMPLNAVARELGVPRTTLAHRMARALRHLGGRLSDPDAP